MAVTVPWVSPTATRIPPRCGKPVFFILNPTPIDPRGRTEVTLCPRPVESPREQSEIGVTKFGAPAEQTDGDKEISVGKKRTAEPSTIWYWAELGHEVRIRSGDTICQ